MTNIFNEYNNSHDGHYNSVLKMNSDYLMVKSNDKSNHAWLKTFKISNSGKTLTEDWKIKLSTTSDNDNERSLFQIDGDVFGAIYSGASSDGYVEAVTMLTTDTKKPVFVSSQMSFDNAQFMIELDEPVFRACLLYTSPSPRD